MFAQMPTAIFYKADATVNNGDQADKEPDDRAVIVCHMCADKPELNWKALVRKKLS